MLNLLSGFSVAVNTQYSKSDTKKQTAKTEQAQLNVQVCIAVKSVTGNSIFEKLGTFNLKE